MFNDKYGLTEAVLNGRKTQTRRVIPCSVLAKAEDRRLVYYDSTFDVVSVEQMLLDDGHLSDGKPLFSYRIGEVVAVAQSYYDIEQTETPSVLFVGGRDAGVFNKMFVKAEFMPHHIRITNIRIERLQDISNEDCLKEGIRRTCFRLFYYDKIDDYCTPRGAFAALIDKVSGKGTWDSNPYVFVYDFELVD